MDASVLYKGPDGSNVIFMTQVSEPPPERDTFTDPETGVSVEAELAGANGRDRDLSRSGDAPSLSHRMSNVSTKSGRVPRL